MLRMSNLSKVYRTHMIETHALRGFDIHVQQGEFVTVTGPSGSGKTSFLNIAGLLEEFTDGQYILDGVNVKGMDDNARSRLRAVLEILEKDALHSFARGSLPVLYLRASHDRLVPPTDDIHTGSKVGWVKLDELLPEYEEFRRAV